jgi:OmpA-OmpF porin, OOP family
VLLSLFLPHSRTRSSRSGRSARSGASVALTALLVLAAGACTHPPPRPLYVEESRGPDRDGDGIADMDDRCADEPEDGFAPLANDGCPADDPDLDGVGRLQDRCPEAKEDGQPPAPADGCPNSDSDGDGVADSLDKCPGIREDNLPPQPNDGCPSADRDRDGVADAIDRCPDQPETLNGWEDSDGCPDTPPAGTAVVVDQREMTVHLGTVTFEFAVGSMVLTANGQAAAREAAQLLNAHPEWDRIEIEGHASAKGDDKANVSLTLERARSVGRALAANRVDPKRLAPIGYGEYCPRIDRGDEVDEPQNRRVELKIVRISGHWQDVSRGCWRAKQAGIDPARAQSGIPVASASTPVETHGGGV